jgi:hypothetical protein
MGFSGGEGDDRKNLESSWDRVDSAAKIAGKFWGSEALGDFSDWFGKSACPHIGV